MRLRFSRAATRCPNQDPGYSLVELIIVVALIAILATLAVPQFLRYWARTKQTEAKANLAAIHTAEMAYFAEQNRYTDSFSALGITIIGADQRYYYELGGANAGQLPPGCTPSGLDGVQPTGGFTAAATGNIDTDAVCDVWTINDQRRMINVVNDVAN